VGCVRAAPPVAVLLLRPLRGAASKLEGHRCHLITWCGWCEPRDTTASNSIPGQAQGHAHTLQFRFPIALPRALPSPPAGKGGAATLGKAGVKTTHALIGQYLLLRTPGMSTQQWCDAFWQWLADAGIDSYRSGIVHAVAEKVDLLIPGSFDKTELDSGVM
jgi:hypothetical protein